MIRIMIDLTVSQIQDTLRSYRFSPDVGQCAAIKAYVSLLLRWNQRISLTTVVDPLEILRFHFGESIFAASVVPIRKSRLADVGTGAGFPGIPLLIAVPDLSLTLIESNVRKAAFLSEVVRELKLRSVNIIRSRMESIPPDPGRFDCVTARALGGYDTLLHWSRRRLAKDGGIILWLGTDELKAISGDPLWHWNDPTLIPGSKGRFLLFGSRLDQ
jgi:16S rRNA (guanine527-N7)-methyltransferase